MIKEFFESLKIKDIVFFVLFIVLFSMVLKKNKKEGFTSYVYDAPDFKTKVETALGNNLTAIQNLGNFAGQLITANNELNLSAVDLKVKSLEVKNGTSYTNVLNDLNLKANSDNVDSKLEKKQPVGDYATKKQLQDVVNTLQSSQKVGNAAKAVKASLSGFR